MPIIKHHTHNVSVQDTGVILGPRGLPLKQRITKNGYARIVVYVRGKHTSLLVHRLVADMFVYNVNVNQNVVNHLDGNKLNNHYTNLEWCSRSENMIHAYKTGLMPSQKGTNHSGVSGELNGRCKLSKYQVDEIRKIYSSGYPRGLKPWLKYNISKSMFRNIIRGNNWGDNQ